MITLISTIGWVALLIFVAKKAVETGYKEGYEKGNAEGFIKGMDNQRELNEYLKNNASN